jgi:hypothetical protein
MLSKLRPTSRWTSKVSMRNKMLKNYHDDSLSGHMGANKTLAKLQERYWWPKMFYVRTCERCARMKLQNGVAPAPLQPLKVEEIFDRIQIDHVGPLARCKGTHNA